MWVTDGPEVTTPVFREIYLNQYIHYECFVMQNRFAYVKKDFFVFLHIRHKESWPSGTSELNRRRSLNARLIVFGSHLGLGELLFTLTVLG